MCIFQKLLGSKLTKLDIRSSEYLNLQLGYLSNNTKKKEKFAFKVHARPIEYEQTSRRFNVQLIHATEKLQEPA